MSDPSDVERLTILGEELPVRISDSDGVAHEALKLLEQKIESIREGSNPPSNLKLALLSSLNLAGELVKERKNPNEETLSEETTQRLNQLSDRLDKLLSEN